MRPGSLLATSGAHDEALSSSSTVAVRTCAGFGLQARIQLVEADFTCAFARRESTVCTALPTTLS